MTGSENHSATQPRRKLIFAWNYRNWGGAQIYLLAIIKEAGPEWDVLVLLPKGSSPDIVGFLDEIGARYEFLDAEVDLSGGTKTIGQRAVRFFGRFRAEYRTFRRLTAFDLPSVIVHVEFAPWQSWQFYTLLAWRRANVFMTMHNMLPNYPAWRAAIWKARLQFVSRLRGFHIFASNHDTRNKLKGWVDDGFWQNIPVTYTCVNPLQIEEAREKPFNKAETLAKHGIRPADLIVLCVAQFIDRKGRWTFLEAASTVAAENSDITFVWVSPEAPTEDELQRIASYGLSDRFSIVISRNIGRTRADILSFFKIGDIFVLPSFVEGLPISLLEAMAMGLPVISTRVNAIPEAVIDGETGILIEAGDGAGLAREIKELASDTEKRTRLAAAGREYVLANFDERVASRIALSEYRKCFE